MDEQDQIKALQQLIATKDAEISSLMRSAEESMQKVEQHQATIARLQGELSACRDDLFRLQPMEEIPDNEIVKEYDNLTHRILNWVDHEIALLEDQAKGQELFSDGGYPKLANMLKEFPSAGEHLVGALIHQKLQQLLLGKNMFLFAMDPVEVDMLKGIQASMANLEPKRGMTL